MANIHIQKRQCLKEPLLVVPHHSVVESSPFPIFILTHMSLEENLHLFMEVPPLYGSTTRGGKMSRGRVRGQEWSVECTKERAENAAEIGPP